MRLIDADALSKAMYDEAFENDESYNETNPMARWDSGLWIRYKMFENILKEAPTIEPCEDAISREWLLKFFKEDEGKGRHTPIDSLIALIEDAPSVAPSRPSGEWIPCSKDGLALTELMRRDGRKWYGYKCSKCNEIYKGNALLECNFCPNCGAKMKENE